MWWRERGRQQGEEDGRREPADKPEKTRLGSREECVSTKTYPRHWAIWQQDVSSKPGEKSGWEASDQKAHPRPCQDIEHDLSQGVGEDVCSEPDEGQFKTLVKRPMWRPGARQWRRRRSGPVPTPRWRHQSRARSRTRSRWQRRFHPKLRARRQPRPPTIPQSRHHQCPGQDLWEDPGRAPLGKTSTRSVKTTGNFMWKLMCTFLVKTATV